MALRICDITMFYPTQHPGGVKSYIQTKKAYILQHTEHAHATIIPAANSSRTLLGGRDYLYEIKSPPLPWNPSYRLLYSYAAVEAALKEFRPDVIEVGDAYLSPWLVWKVYKKNPELPKPIIVGFYHADFPQSDLYTLLKPLSLTIAAWVRQQAQRYAAKVYNRMQRCLVSSPMMAERLKKTGINNVAVVPFGVDTDIFRPIGQPLASAQTLNLLFVGRLSAEKWILPFIDIMHELVASGSNVDLTVVGDGYLETAARKKANNAPYIRFVPCVYAKDELARLYSTHDLLIVPNPNETFCISALEAMVCGTPVASLNGFGGIETIINDKTGFLLGNQISAFVPFLKSISRLKLMAMRQQVRDTTITKFSHTVRFAHLMQIYTELTHYAVAAPQKVGSANEF